MIDVRRFELAPGEAASLDAVWTISADGRVLHSARAVIVERTVGAGPDALVGAMSRATEQPARDIAAALPASLPRSREVRTDQCAHVHAF